MKRLFHSLLIAVMVFTAAGTAFGASWDGAFVNPAFSDVAGHRAEHDLTVLAALGVYEGYQGKARPDDPITRAEFCKVLVETFGRGGMAAALMGLEPAFTDGASVPAWAWGYVNVAVYMDLVRGYPDGTFGPNNNVTYAEAVTMLIRAVPGHAAQVPAGLWPYDHVFYGVDNDFTGAVDLSFPNLPASRGDVARLLFATMFVPEVDAAGAIRPDTELLHGRWAHEVVTTYDLAAGTVNGQGLAAEVHLLGGESLEDLRQVDCEFIYDSAGAGKQIAFIGLYEETGVIRGTFARLDTNDDAHNVIVLADGTEVLYDNAGTVNVVLNGVTGKVVGDLAVSGSDQVIITLDADGHAVNIVAEREDHTNDILVDTASRQTTDPAGTDGSIEIVGHSSYYLKAGARITLNGSPAALSDLAADDILYIGTYGAGGLGSHIWSIRAIRDTVEGTKVTERTVYPGEKRYVTLKLADGSEQEYRYLFGAGYHNDFGAGFPTNGTFALNADGAIVHAKAYTTSSDFVLVKQFTDVGGSATDTVVVDIRGTEVAFATDFDFGTAGYVGQLGKLVRDAGTNLVTGFEPAWLVGSYDILSVDATGGTMTITNGTVEFVEDPIVYNWDEDLGEYVYAPYAGIDLDWELHKDLNPGSKLYGTGPLNFSGVLNLDQLTNYPTIQAAVADANSGDHLLVAPGDYEVSPTAQLNIDTPVHLASAVLHGAVIRQTYPIAINHTATGTSLDGFYFDHNFEQPSSTLGDGLTISATGATISNCYFDAMSGPSGVHYYRGDTGQVAGTRGFTIAVHGYATSLTVSNNTFRGYGSAIFLENGATAAIVTGNDLSAIYYGLFLWDEAVGAFTGNHFTGFCNIPILVSNEVVSTFTGNVWHYIGVYYFWAGGDAYTNRAYGDALITNNVFAGTPYSRDTGYSWEIIE